MRNHRIEPSADFAENTIKRIVEAYKHRIMITKIFIIISMFSPFIVRQIWDIARHDYFSIVNWPLSDYVLLIYRFSISHFTTYIMLGLGMFSAFMYLWGVKFLTPAFKYFGHFFGKQLKARA